MEYPTKISRDWEFCPRMHGMTNP